MAYNKDTKKKAKKLLVDYPELNDRKKLVEIADQLVGGLNKHRGDIYRIQNAELKRLGAGSSFDVQKVGSPISGGAFTKFSDDAKRQISRENAAIRLQREAAMVYYAAAGLSQPNAGKRTSQIVNNGKPKSAGFGIPKGTRITQASLNRSM